ILSGYTQGFSKGTITQAGNTLTHRKGSHFVANGNNFSPAFVTGSAARQRIFKPRPAFPYRHVRSADSAAFQTDHNVVITVFRYLLLLHHKIPGSGQHCYAMTSRQVLVVFMDGEITGHWHDSKLLVHIQGR